MLYINTKRLSENSCGFFFGLEEYLIKDWNTTEDLFMLWKVKPTVMIGRHQVTTMELDESYVKMHGIDVVRRNSGGGAVYTDPGCLQFSFITDKMHHQDIFKSHVSSIIAALKKIGIAAEFTGRNDIVVDGQKFSGNAEYIYKDKMVIHGTILFDTNMDHLIGALTPDKSKLTKHAISSVKSRVVNISTKTDMPLDEFYDYIVKEVSTDVLEMDSFDLKKIHTYEQKFSLDIWNYGKNPAYEYNKTMSFSSGQYTAQVKVKKNIVEDFHLTGDYFAVGDISAFLHFFINQPFTKESFVRITKEHKVKDYIYELKRTEFLQLFFDEDNTRKMAKPDYLKVDLQDLNKQTKQIRTLLKQHNLHTVCQEASCPNQMECFSHKTATFMILGTRCTRNCSFCDVIQGPPDKIDKDEPENILKAVKIMNLKHVVITSVTRDDLRGDYGSSHFVDCIKTLQTGAPNTTIEVLIPDFLGDYDSLKRVVDAKPDVINHNIETVRRIYPGFRDRADYDRTLLVLKRVKEMDPTMLTKTGFMLGVGETKEEVIELMKDLRDVNCDIVTIGQYLQPSKEHREVSEYISLETFEEYKQIGKQLGFRFIASGPMVRSSYEAHKQFKGEM